MAQMVERVLGKDEVTGSIPVSSSMKKAIAKSNCFFQLYSPYGERYCCAVIFAFPPSDIRLARVRCEYNIIVSFSQQYHFLRREALQRGFPGRLVPLCIPHSALRIIVPYAVNKLWITLLKSYPQFPQTYPQLRIYRQLSVNNSGETTYPHRKNTPSGCG